MKAERSQSTGKDSSAFNKAGFSLVEVLLSISICSLVIVILVGTPLYSEQTLIWAGSRDEATLLAEEGLEAVRNLRDASYSNLVPGTYGLGSSNGRWELIAPPDTTDIYSRSIVISSLSPSTTEVVSTVSWQRGIQSDSVSITTILTDWK